MNVKVTYEPLNEKYVDEAVDLVLSAYKDERHSISYLPSEEDLKNPLKKLVSYIIKNGNGVVAVDDNKLIGFVAGYEATELFGKCKGIYTPLYGHGVAKEYGSRLYKELYKNVANKWVKESFTSHAITCFVHDEETIKTWFWMGFGLRCVDAIRETESIDSCSSEITITKADVSHIPILADIHRKHNEYYRESPIFMPRMEEDPIDDLTEWLSKENHHLWIAYHDGQPLGYMRIEPSAETFVSEHKDVMNITAGYVSQEERKSGIGTMLLREIQIWLKQNGYPLCGVDFESINIAGSSFWNKHFRPYTYSLVRRIDERIIG